VLMPLARGGRGCFCSSRVGGGAMVDAGIVSANTGATASMAAMNRAFFMMSHPSDFPGS
jgi:hypothetical protein